MARSLFYLAKASYLISLFSTALASELSPVPANPLLLGRQLGQICIRDDYLLGFEAFPRAATSLCSCFLTLSTVTSVIQTTAELTTTTTVGSATNVAATVTVPSGTTTVVQYTIVPFKKRDAEPEPMPEPTAAPALEDAADMAFKNLSPEHKIKMLERQVSGAPLLVSTEFCNTTSILSAMSSACNCLGIPTPTITVTSTINTTRIITAVQYSGVPTTILTTSGISTVIRTDTLYSRTPSISLPGTGIPTPGTSIPTGISSAPFPISSPTIPSSLVTGVTTPPVSVDTLVPGISPSLSIPSFSPPVVNDRNFTTTITGNNFTTTVIITAPTTFTIPGSTVTITSVPRDFIPGASSAAPNATTSASLTISVSANVSVSASASPPPPPVSSGIPNPSGNLSTIPSVTPTVVPTLNVTSSPSAGFTSIFTSVIGTGSAWTTNITLLSTTAFVPPTPSSGTGLPTPSLNSSVTRIFPNSTSPGSASFTGIIPTSILNSTVPSSGLPTVSPNSTLPSGSPLPSLNSSIPLTSGPVTGGPSSSPSVGSISVPVNITTTITAVPPITTTISSLTTILSTANITIPTIPRSFTTQTITTNSSTYTITTYVPTDPVPPITTGASGPFYPGIYTSIYSWQSIYTYVTTISGVYTTVINGVSTTIVSLPTVFPSGTSFTSFYEIPAPSTYTNLPPVYASPITTPPAPTPTASAGAGAQASASAGATFRPRLIRRQMNDNDRLAEAEQNQ